MSDEFFNSEPEILWDRLLSREPGQILSAYSSLTAAERSTVTAHLKRMADEPGWHAEQRKSALIALETIRSEKG